MAKNTLDFNMAEEIRLLLQADNTLTGTQVVTALKAKFPKAKINPKSCGVAVSGARKKLGIKGRRKVVRKKRPAGAAATQSSSPLNFDFDALRAAKQYLASCGGNTDVAVAALKQLSSLQIS